MSAMKSVVVMLIVILVAQTQLITMSQAQTCTASLTNLNSCAPFVVPGAINTVPNPECCSAIQAVDHECICNTLRIASRMPAQCNLPPLSCAAN